MWSLSSSYSPTIAMPVLHYLFLVCMLNIAQTRELGEQRPFNSSISAVFVFGDSTVDSGNNNYITTALKSDFPPYGRDFPNHVPTGRFTNGRLVTDFVASYVGVKEYIPAYLDPTLSLDDLMTGVCFASAGSGFDPLTAQLDSVISIESQLKYFKEYKARLVANIGKKRTQNLINKALFLISAGTNDFVVNYYGALPIRRQTYNNISNYQQFLLQLSQKLVEDLLDLGARTIGVVGLPPIGCLPVVISLNFENAIANRGCSESLSFVGRDYNRMLQNKLKTIKIDGAKIIYVDIYKPLDEMIKNPHAFGFNKVNVGCCGSGLLETAILCNSNSFVCSDASKFVFWDSVHPTESTYYKIFEVVRPILDDILMMPT